MDLLLDTHALIWFFNGDSLLPENVKEAIIKLQKLNVQRCIRVAECGGMDAPVPEMVKVLARLTRKALG